MKRALIALVLALAALTLLVSLASAATAASHQLGPEASPAVAADSGPSSQAETGK
jgi:hypothetical protein